LVTHADPLAAQAEYPFTELRLSHSPWLAQWYFGSFRYRLAPGPWARGVWRFLHATVGGLPMAALLFVGLLRPGCRLPKLWLGSTLVVTLIFTNLVLEHWHYYLMCCPAVAMLCGLALCRGDELLAQEVRSIWLRLGLVCVVLIFSAIDGLNSMKLAGDYDPSTRELSASIRQYTRPTDKLLVFNDHLIWGGEILFRSDRQGLVLSCLRGSRFTPSPKGLYDVLENQVDLDRLRTLGYNRLVLTSESPVQFALIADKPGSKRRRELYPATISPRVDAWPTIFRSEDILIKEIPRGSVLKPPPFSGEIPNPLVDRGIALVPIGDRPMFKPNSGPGQNSPALVAHTAARASRDRAAAIPSGHAQSHPEWLDLSSEN
jgi:hypothetical protein